MHWNFHNVISRYECLTIIEIIRNAVRGYESNAKLKVKQNVIMINIFSRWVNILLTPYRWMEFFHMFLSVLTPAASRQE